MSKYKLLDKLLKKRGLKNETELSGEEQQTYEAWKEILSKEELSVPEMAEFCNRQISVIESKWRDLDVPQARKNEFIPYHTVYKALLEAIESPQHARKALEMQLNQLLQ